MGNNWIQDFSGSPHYAPSYKVRETLIEEQSEYQNIKVVNLYQFGKTLLLDDIIQLTEADEFIYHEMLNHIPLLAHPNPQRVCIVGGGDGCSLREVLRHQVEKVTMVELDKKVVELSRRYLSDISKNPFSNPRVKIVFSEASVFLKENSEIYDVIIIDSTDPIGEGAKLFTPNFYQTSFNSLSEDGLMAVQSGCPIFQPDLIRMVISNMKAIFPLVRLYTGVVPSYPGVYWSFTIGSKTIRVDEIEREELASRINDRGLSFRYYNPEIHRACFVLPEFVKRILSGELDHGIFDAAE